MITENLPEFIAKELINAYLKSGMTIEPAKRCSLICTHNEFLARINTLEAVSEHLTDIQFQTEFKRIVNWCEELEDEINKL